MAEQFNTVTTSSASCRYWKYFFYLTVSPSYIFQSVRGRLNQHQSQQNHALNSFASPYQYQTLQVVLLSCRIRSLASPRRPNRQLRAQRAHLPASTFTTITAINYLGIMIGFPVLLAFALTNHTGHSILLYEAGIAQHSHRAAMEMSRVHEDERDRPRSPEA
jgi:hypothetical protein